MDRAVARRDVAGLGDRRTARCKQDRDIVAGGVHQPVDRVAGTDGDVDHDGRRLSGNLVVAVRHGHRDVLMGHGDDARKLAAPIGVHGKRLDERREIRTGIGENVLDAALGEPCEISLRGDFSGFWIKHR